MSNEQREFLFEAAEIDGARRDVAALGDLLGESAKAIVDWLANRQRVGDIVHRLRQPPVREKLVVVGRVVRQIDRRRELEALYEHALDLVRRVAVLARPAHDSHVALGDPRAGRIEQCVGHGLVVDALEEAEEADGAP